MDRSEPVASILLKWFEKNRREFPWRLQYEKGNPYAILFAELMLQRTRADQVAAVYTKFIERYPTLADLCAASERDVQSILKPLGLNWRIRRIINVIRHLKSNGMEIPSSYEELTGLPGVGEYTARAMMSYAYMQDAVALDVNVMRIFSRIFGMPYKKGSKPTNAMREFAMQTIPRGKAKEFNMALMDFGALVCRERGPLCKVCPLRAHCSFYKQQPSADRSNCTSMAKKL